MPVSAAARSRARVCSRLLAGIAGSNPAGAWMSVSYECCVLSGRGLRDGLITRPEESYRVWYVWVWSWILDSEEDPGTLGTVALWREKIIMYIKPMFRIPRHN